MSYTNIPHRRPWRVTAAFVTACVPAALVIPSAATAAPGDSQARAGAEPLRVNLAIGAAATASSALTGQPPGNAVDGSASTGWCATQWTGDLTVDLGQVRTIDGIGVTLAATASPSTAALALAPTEGDWQPVSSAQNVALNGNSPSYIRLPHPQSARFARLTVTTGDGTPACVGEFRLFGTSPATDSMMLGADLSFTQQELAAGTQFTDAGKLSDPVRILRAHGGNYARMRLWVNPPAGYSDLGNDLWLARQARAAGMRIYLDIHYSDFWADPQHQDTPAAWQAQDLATLADTVRQYTHDVITAFAKQGTPVYGVDRK